MRPGQWTSDGVTVRVRCARVVVCIVLLCQAHEALEDASPSKKALTLRRAYLGLDKCNACVGTSICKKLFKNHIRFDWWMFPEQAVPSDDRQSFLGNLTDDLQSWRPVLLSFLSSPHQHNLSDLFICRSAGKQGPCSIEAVLTATPRFQRWKRSHLLLPHMVQGLAPPLLRCPSQRLLDRLVRRYAEVADVGSLQMKHFTEKDKLRLLYTLTVSQHPLVLQMFPGAEGWPFPRYHGACGRLMVWTSSRPLSALYGASMEQRADAVYQLIQLSQGLDSNSLGFRLYYTQLGEDMFGLLEDGRLIISDASTIGVIDLVQGFPPDRPSPSGPDEDIFACLGQGTSPCSQPPPCRSVRPSQSFTMLCRHLLPKLLSVREAQAGHEIGTDAGRLPSNVTLLLRVCADPSQPDWRILWAVQALKDTLKPLRPCSQDYSYRFPECRYNQGY
uniref:Divergent protein kinase domain 2B n=2 Tax=Myripristis murdjan TaxID=586833 RepID=A0A668AXX4_9TELE